MNGEIIRNDLLWDRYVVVDKIRLEMIMTRTMAVDKTAHQVLNMTGVIYNLFRCVDYNWR